MDISLVDEDVLGDDSASKEPFPEPGMIGDLGGYLARYFESAICLGNTLMPAGTLVTKNKGVGTTTHLNHLVKTMLENEHCAWLWIVGDDCVYPPNLLQRLRKRDVDVVVPLIGSDQYPYDPEIFTADYERVQAKWLQGKEGLVECTDMLFNWRGMLIKRHVLEQLEEPCFVNGKTLPESLGSDLWFCERVYEKGMTIHLDMENTMGRIAHIGWWPHRLDDGTWDKRVYEALPWGWS